MAILGIVRTIESAHGRKMHGHSFRIDIRLRGEVKDDMVEGIDFHDARAQINTVLDALDKKYLDEVIGRATVENIAIHIIRQLKSLPVDSVTVWETANQYATISAGEVG